MTIYSNALLQMYIKLQFGSKSNTPLNFQTPLFLISNKNSQQFSSTGAISNVYWTRSEKKNVFAAKLRLQKLWLQDSLYSNAQFPQQLNLQLQMTDNQLINQNLKIFSLIRLKAECKIAPVRVDFEAPYRPNTTPTSIIPTFNTDGSYFTPSFLLPADKKYYDDNSAFEKSQFEEKIQRSVQETTSILNLSAHQDIYVAVPNSNFCQICQEKFDCYNQHINLKQHRTRTQNSDTSNLISQLCTQFRTRVQKDVKGSKTKGIRKDNKRQERGLIEKKMNTNKKRTPKDNQSVVKGQNFSTCLLQDSLRQFIV